MNSEHFYLSQEKVQNLNQFETFYLAITENLFFKDGT